MKESEHKHVKTLGDRWGSVLAATSMSVRLNSKLVGIDKIRDPLAVQAALRATRCPGVIGFCIPKTAGKPAPDIQDFVDVAWSDAVSAGERAFDNIKVEA